MLVVLIDVQPVRSKSIIFVPHDYYTVQEAINAASDGDIIIVSSYSYEYVVVNKSVSLQGYGGAHLRGINVVVDNVSIDNFWVSVWPPGWWPYGNPIVLNGVSGCNISDMYIYDINEGRGIVLRESSNNIISNNVIEGLIWDGSIVLESSFNNTIVGNGVDSTIYLDNSSGNRFFHNKLLPAEYVTILGDSINAWDNGYPEGGNYWNSYSGSDLYSGPFQNETGSDGIGDAPYNIDGGNQDNYPLVTHNVAIADVTPSKTVIGEELSMNISVAVENQGDYTETFTVTAYANSSIIDAPVNTTLESGHTALLIFAWKTTGFTKGKYRLSAYATPVPSETSLEDNNFTDGFVFISIVGDITGPDGWPDGTCDMRDVGLVSRHFGKTVPPAPPNCDITGPVTGVTDGKIDMRDIGLTARHFGETDP